MIDQQDLYKQEKVYTKSGQGRWRALGYCHEPSVTMINLDTNERCNFGLGGSLNETFEEVSRGEDGI